LEEALNNQAESQSLITSENKLFNIICLFSIFTGAFSSLILLIPPIIISLPEPIGRALDSILAHVDLSFFFSEPMVLASLVIGIIGVLLNLYLLSRKEEFISNKFIIGLVVNGFTILAFYIYTEFGKTICCQPGPLTF
jgi:hypothetical protein